MLFVGHTNSNSYILEDIKIVSLQTEAADNWEK